MTPKSCDACRHGARHYCDGLVRKDWTGYWHPPQVLPDPPDPDAYWTYLECAKNSKGLRYLNLDGKCPAFTPL